MYQYKYTEFDYLFNKILIQQSINIPIPKALADDIKLKFQLNNKLVYRKAELIKLDSRYLNFAKDSLYTLTVFIINDDTESINKIFIPLEKSFINTKISDIQFGLKTNFGIYIQTKKGCGYLILNYRLIKNNLNLIDEIIDNELKHYYDSNNNENQWQDLLPKNSQEFVKLFPKLSNIFGLITFKLNITYDTMYYLTSKNQFEAFCTTLTYYKDNINTYNINIQFLLSNQFQNEPIQLKKIYLFLILNKYFAKNKYRIQYMLNHLK